MGIFAKRMKNVLCMNVCEALSWTDSPPKYARMTSWIANSSIWIESRNLNCITKKTVSQLNCLWTEIIHNYHPVGLFFYSFSSFIPYITFTWILTIVHFQEDYILSNMHKILLLHAIHSGHIDDWRKVIFYDVNACLCLCANF